MHDRLTLLNNPVWHALQTTHKPFAIGAAAVCRYPADVLPFLHVLTTNTRAIGLYELLGFEKRREIMFRQVALAGGPL